MTHGSAAEFRCAFGEMSDKALTQPIAITKHGRDHLVLLSAEEHARLKRRDRRVFAVEDVSGEQIMAIEQSRMDPRHDHLNAELESCEP
jgi:hypothetical protein